MMNLWKFNGGVKLSGHKALSNTQPIIKAELPKYLILPLLQHIGVPAEAVVNVGDKVLKGQVVARCQSDNCDLFASSPIHASSSGTVVAIEDRLVPHPSGLHAPCIVIETDGQDTWADKTPLAHYQELPPAEVRQHIARAGIVGLGGAGFPSHMKLRPEGIDTLILNGAECEPYITCDDRLMRERPDEIVSGAEILMYVLGGAKRCLIAVEDNKPEAFEALQAAVARRSRIGCDHCRMEVVQVPTRYPTGGERQLIQVLTGKEIGRSDLPARFGIVMHNVETTKAIYRAVVHGEPLISRTVTVTGGGVSEPRNLEAPLGMPMYSLLEQCGKTDAIKRLVMGGPMMGFALPSDELPIVKTTNCLIAYRDNEISLKPEPMPCIRCGACADACPVNLLPQQLYWYAKSRDFKQVQSHHIFECIDCACCAYVCPSHIPLVDYFRFAKAEIRAADRDKQKADHARQRHELRQQRIEREKAEKAARHQQKRSAPEDQETADRKKAEIAAAVARTQAKKAQAANNTPENQAEQ